MTEVTLIDFSYLNRLALSTFTEGGPQFLNQDSRLGQVIVIAQVPGIYGSKQTESEGVARGRGLFTTAINPWPPVL